MGEESPRYEYILVAWKTKPQNPQEESDSAWRVHVKGAHDIPRIGEKVSSIGYGPDDGCNEFRVFDVVHPIGGGLSELVTQHRSCLRETTVPCGSDGLIEVMAYRLPTN